jgi:hypothetical protein
MRGADDFYWLEVESGGNRNVSGRKDLLLTQAEFSETLSRTVPIYRRERWGRDEFIAHYALERGARELLTAGYKDAVTRERASFMYQLRAVAAVGIASVGFLALQAEVPPRALVGYAAAVAAAWLIKTVRASTETKNADLVLEGISTRGEGSR